MTRPFALGIAVVALVLAASACGDSPKKAVVDGGTDTPVEDGGDSPDDRDGGEQRDGATSPDSGSEDGGSDDDAGQTTCSVSCAPDDCGEVVNCAGGFLSCPACAEGYVCGQYALNKCGLPPPDECEPQTAADVCTGKCGAVSDGCSGVVQCTANNGGVACDDGEDCKDAVCTARSAPPCQPLTCADPNVDNQCGVGSDGCGGVLDCGTCAANETCDNQATHSKCVEAVPPCAPQTRAAACAGNCGIVGDGCGGTIDCEADASTRCPTGETCGGGGVSGECGSSGQACVITPASVVCAGKCGSQPDGCGGVHICDGNNGGQTCDTSIGETCGGGGVPSQCGVVPCTPRTAAQACPVASGEAKSCGQQPDGCGGLVDCGGCASNQQCGLTTANFCGTIPSCMPVPVATACSGKCGMVPDGCGGTYTCNGGNGGVTCTGSEYCGANGMANKCGSPVATCTPRTCAQLGHTCGLASDGCGKVLNCWAGCAANDPSCSQTCGTSSSCLSNETGAQSCVSGGPACNGALCSSLPTTCTASSPTRLTGRVVTPGRASGNTFINRLPVPNAIVYIPAAPSSTLPSIYEGVTAGNPASCGRCEDEKLVPDDESVLAVAVTDYKGDFVLEGRIPIGTAFRVVIKVGKWRRVVQVPSTTVAACATRALTVDQTRLAASSTDGLAGTRLPKIAVSTGAVDEMECVFRNLGIVESEFTVPSGTGRVHLYRSNGAMMPGTCVGTYGFGTSCASNSNRGCFENRSGCSWSNADSLLYTDQARLNAYDLVVWDCEGAEEQHDTHDPKILSYVNAGGRMFASHYSYTWIEGNGTLDQSAAWRTNGDAISATGFISLTSGSTARTRANPIKAPLFRNWLDYQGALTGSTAGKLTTPPPVSFTISEPRDRAGATVGPSTDEWVYRDSSGPKVQQLSFNTPYGATSANICGRVAYSGFHVSATDNNDNNDYFPGVCSSGELTAQEKILAFMLFDLATCVSAGEPPKPPACVPKTVANTCPGANDACGFVSDGCGGVVDCGGCAAGSYCDGNTCRPQECTPSTCSSLGFNCGDHADGCGGIARNAQGMEGCGTCSGGQTCGLTQPGICGGCNEIPYETACPANSCGQVSNGCGGTHDCGTCPTGLCGGAGPNRCGTNTCTRIPQATACASKNCGLVADGCGGTYNCGTCTAPQTCGGAGKPNVCGAPVCTKKTLDQACGMPGYDCGYVSDGCGGVLDCGKCSDGGVCGGGGTNKCGGSCTKTTCTMAGAQCGAIADLCGGLLDCGMCPTGQTCGASMPNKCATGPACTPTTCAVAGAECGLIGDGCGGVLDCGTCTSPETCGGGGMANQCGTGTGGCNKRTCAEPLVQCGPATDGCGGVLDCGSCPSGYQCTDGTCNPILI